MRKILLPAILFISAAACTNLTQNQSKSSSNTMDTTKRVNPIDTLKTLNEVKLALLDARNEKAQLLLGKPDSKGRIMMGHFYYMVYFDKIKDGNSIKHLLLLINGKSGISDESPIYKIIALNDGETEYGAGNQFQNIKVSRKGLSSNSREFISTDGFVEWYKII
ncbi:hypothetical protein ACFSR6_00080 [Pedobacter vanadiisoli]|uniref:Lipoprotein n=1 Tax=Pedobacter vanadiisoli TaxID=1761975 RepID=A0ABW5MDY5_9SPHI